MIPDYNNGEFHGWNGGECPVHPKSIVQMQLACETRMEVLAEDPSCHLVASEIDWQHIGVTTDIIAFRVVTPYVEPREPRRIWRNRYADSWGVTFENYDRAIRAAKRGGAIETVEFVEVIK